MAQESGGSVTPVTAWHVPLMFSLTWTHRALDVDRMGLEAEAGALAEAAVASLVAPDGVVAEPVVVEGHPAQALLDMSSENSCIVVGRRGISDLRHRLLGSVSRDLATHADGAVVVVPSSWSPTACRRIVVGFDGSSHAQSALRWALDVAPEDATVTALIAIDVVPWLRPDLVRDRYGDEVDTARERILEAAATVDPDEHAQRVVVLHSPRQALAEATDDADLVVVGPRGMGGVARTILGSVTTWLLHDAPCPVAVVSER